MRKRIRTEKIIGVTNSFILYKKYKFMLIPLVTKKMHISQYSQTIYLFSTIIISVNLKIIVAP